MRVQDVHPKTQKATSLTIEVYEAAIALREREIKTYRRAIEALRAVGADEILPRNATEAMLDDAVDTLANGGERRTTAGVLERRFTGDEVVEPARG